MRILVTHKTVYRYDPPPVEVIQTLRLTPRNHDGQFVADWRIDISSDCRLVQSEDAFGNIIHVFTATDAIDELIVSVDGEVEVLDTHGVIRGTIERFPPGLYLRETQLTKLDEAIATFAADVDAKAGTDTLERLHALQSALYREISYDTDPTHTATTASEAFALKRGVCQDLTHIFIAAARSLGSPARYIGGYFHRVDGVVEQDAGHAWAEVFVPDLGWVGFDPANGICTTDAYVRVAVGLDYLGAAPVRGSRYGGGTESMAVSVQVAQARQQVQS
jgi:transglutaminase-like putative cysteine protease